MASQGSVSKKIDRNKKGKKGLGKGTKVFLMFLVLAFVTIFLYQGVNLLKAKINEAKSVIVTVDLEMGSAGDGPGQFREPWGIATDSKGNFYVTDFGGQRVNKFNPEGERLLSFGEPGKKSGEFNQPSGLFVDGEGDIYVCDTFNHRIQKFDSKGKVLKTWSHSFFGPRSIAGNEKGRIYVADTGNHKIQVFDEDGKFLSEWGGFGTADGKFREPVGVAVDPAGNVYVADSDNLRVQKFDMNGKFINSFRISTWRGKNVETPYLAVGQNFLYVSNAGERAVLKYDLSGKLIAICRKKEKDGFYMASGVAVDPQGRVYVVERGPGRIARFTIPLNPQPAK